MPNFREVAGQWREQMSDAVDAEAEAHPVTRLSLTRSHPGGLAQLYAERQTRLSSLVRSEAAYEVAAATGHEVIEQALRMLQQHGSVTVHLAIGTATWHDGVAEHATPVLLRPVEITEEAGQISLQLRPGIEISNRLLAVLARFGQQIDPQQLVDSARTPHGFSPAPALDFIRGLGASVPGLTIRDTLTIGVYSHPAGSLLRELGAPQWLSLSPLVRALAGDTEAQKAIVADLPEPNPADRDPWAERGLGENSPAAADVIEAATGEDSLVVRLPAGADLPLTVAAIAGDHAAQGRKVLIVTGNAALQEQVQAELEDRGAPGISNRVDTSAESAASVQGALQQALIDASDPLDTDALEGMRQRLRDVRQTLAEHTATLHQEFPRWGVSPFDALQILTDLTSLRLGPTTTVRFDDETLTRLAASDGKGAALLEEADRLGVFSQTSDDGWWDDVTLKTQEQVTEVLAAVGELSRKLLPELERQMQRASEETGLLLAQNVQQWEDQLTLLRGVEDSLDVFRPIVFERSAADMVIATATKEWRRSRSIDMPGSRRRRLVRQARDLVIPGRYVQDLHAELVKVQQRRKGWSEQTEIDSWPALPDEMPTLYATNASTVRQLEIVAPYLEPVYGPLQEMSIEELGGLMDALEAERARAYELPGQVHVLGQLKQLGVMELVRDLRKRRIRGELLTQELDLAWWASALQRMLAAEPRLGGSDPSQLQDRLQELRRLEEAQVESLGPQIRNRVMRLRQSALAANPQTYQQTTDALAARASATTYYSRVPLAWDLAPIVIAAPAVVPLVVPWGRYVDVVIVAGFAPDADLATLVPVLARGRQVIVVADDQVPQPGSLLASLDEVLTSVTMPPAFSRINDSALRLLTDYGIETPGVSVPRRHRHGNKQIVRVEGTGMPAPGMNAIESSSAEVNAVVELVAQHAATRPGEALSVVALNEMHRQRIHSALAHAAGSDPALATFVGVDPRSSGGSFALTGPAGAGRLPSDHTIVAVGYAKTPHGRVIHDFGDYSEPEGEQLLAGVLGTVGPHFTVVTSLDPAEVDSERLRLPGARMLIDLLREDSADAAAADWPTLQHEPDHLLVDLAERLYSLGLNVVPNVGVSGGLRIPLGIGHPEAPGQLLVAVLTDDDDYLAEPSLRVRDLQLPRLLEEQGWKVRTELSMAVFVDPNREATAIVQLVLDAVDEFYEEHEDLRPQGAADAGPDLAEVLGGTGARVDVLPSEEGARSAGAEGSDAGAGGSGVHRLSQLVDSGDSALPGEAQDTGDADVSAEAAAGAQEEELDTTDEWLVGELSSAVAGSRPAVAPGLALSAYGDDQLDEVAAWVLENTAPETLDVAAGRVAATLELRHRGAQTDAVLRAVVLRNAGGRFDEPAPADSMAADAGSPDGAAEAAADTADADAVDSENQQ